MRALEVLRAGPLTTVQDRGRFGLRADGVAQCGAIDEVAYRVANALAGNAPGAAAIEIALGSATFRFTSPVRIALCGADGDADLDGERFPRWSSRLARAGATLTTCAGRTAVRSVLAVDGGIDVPAVLGSQSTDLAAGFGGFNGRALRDGDVLALRASRSQLGDREITAMPPQWQFDSATIDMIAGGEYDTIPANWREDFWSAEWRVCAQSNRMGYRMIATSPPRKLESVRELHSHAVFPGVVQLPPSGEPIVLLCDAQTTGGYPKLGVVPGALLWILAQAPAGRAFRFRSTTVDQARDARRKVEAYVEAVCRGLTR